MKCYYNMPIGLPMRQLFDLNNLNGIHRLGATTLNIPTLILYSQFVKMNGSSKFHIFLIFILSLDSKCVSRLAHEQNKKNVKTKQENTKKDGKIHQWDFFHNNDKLFVVIFGVIFCQCNLFVFAANNSKHFGY